ncbi:MAG: hypothetical protein J6X39_03565 [Bacteroidales bacterium]|nr:hypothetical protein [Bacteroidales bacterium]
MRKFVAIALAVLTLVSCNYKEETWIDFMDLSQATSSDFKVFYQSVDNLSKDGVPSNCFVPDGTLLSDYKDTKATGANSTLFVQRLLDVSHGGEITELAGTYTSIDTEGNPITLSGKVMLPSDGKFKRFILVSHYTIGSNAEAPSNCFSLEGVLVPLGYCIIVPDYLGYGITAGKKHPYLALDLTARNTLDMYLAVKPFLSACGIEPEFDDIMLMGYSQGGANTMGVMRLIETKYPDSIKLRRVFAGGGPYDVTATYDQFVKTNHAAYPCAVPLVVQGMQVGAGLSLSMEEFSTPLVYEHLDEWFNSKRYSTKQMNQLLGTYTTSDLISKAGLDRTTYEVAELYMAMNKNSIVKQDWVPKAPVYMLHSMDDDTVDFINAMHARATWPDANIVYNFGHYGGHVPAALRFIYTVKTLLVEEELGL